MPFYFVAIMYNRYILLYTVYRKIGVYFMQIILNHSSMVPIYEQLMEQIKTKIINNELDIEQPLPSVRSLSNELRISALTVKKAYDKLEEEGFVKTVHGKGTFILQTNSNLLKETRYKIIEDSFAKVIEQAKNVGLCEDEIKEMVSILLEDIS